MAPPPAEVWIERFNEVHRCQYWVNMVAKKRQWTMPDVTVGVSASVWVEKFSEEHQRRYWIEKATKKSQWSLPECETQI